MIRTRALTLLAVALVFLIYVAAQGGSTPAIAQQPDAPRNPFLLDEHAVKRLSEHVYVIPSRGRGFVPNIGIIVGSRATMAVDTGMGPRGGEIVVREVERLSKNQDLYLATTHFHPEHITGVQAFPPETKWIVSQAQKDDIDQYAEKYISLFRQRSPDMKALLEGVVLRTPDITFNQEARVDLGGVTVRLLWLGQAHTQGDTFILVEQDGVLFPGDIVQSGLFPNMPDGTANAIGWIAVLDKVEGLHPRVIVPDHGDESGDASLIGKERSLLLEFQARCHELKNQGVSVEDASRQLTTEFAGKHPDWANSNYIPTIVRRFYEEIP